MLGLGYHQKQFYSYQNLEELEVILKLTQAKDYIIHKFENVIEYTIDRKFQIRLSDLIYQIEQDLIRIHVGQLLDLCENILQYVKFLESNNIQHDYLDSNRIWLQLLPKSKFLNVIQNYLKYQIIFTGYQCPFYEQQNYKQKQSLGIQEILIQIINNFMNKKVWLIQDNKKIDKVEFIYQELSQMDQQNVQFSLQQIQSIKGKYQYNSDSQMICLDTEPSKTSDRSYMRQGVFVEIQDLFNNFKGENQLLLEHALMKQVPIYLKYIDSKMSLLSLKIDQKSQEELKNMIEKNEKEKNDFIENFTQQQISQNIQDCNKYFKFEFTENEQTSMKQEIIEEFKKKKIQKYFENSIWFPINQKQMDFKNSYVQECIEELTICLFSLKLQLKVVCTNIDLI